MAISDRNYDNRLSFEGRVNPLVVLIAIAMIVFVVLAFFRALTYVQLPEGGDVGGVFNKNVLCWVALSGKKGAVWYRPWTLLSCTFVHISVWHLFASLVWLWCFGYVLIDLTGYKKVIPVFLYGALSGSVAYLIASALLPARAGSEQYFTGSGAAVLAVCAAATTICPNYKLFRSLNGGISLWVVSIIYLTIDVATLPTGAPALCIAHFSGAFSGWLFVYLLRKGVDGSSWMNNLYDRLIHLFSPESSDFKRNQTQSTLFYKPSKRPFSKAPKMTQQRLDEILDKINLLGYHQLSEDEKDFLRRSGSEDSKER